MAGMTIRYTLSYRQPIVCSFFPLPSSSLEYLPSVGVLVLTSYRKGKKLIEAGWAQRHAFSGTLAMTILTLGRMPDLPSEYVLIYAPRNETEIEIVMQVVAASVRFMTGSDAINEFYLGKD